MRMWCHLLSCKGLTCYIAQRKDGRGAKQTRRDLSLKWDLRTNKEGENRKTLLRKKMCAVIAGTSVLEHQQKNILIEGEGQ